MSVKKDAGMQYEEIINKLKSLSNAEAVEGMARFGINPNNTYGVSIPDLRKIEKENGKNHDLALKLWSSASTKRGYLPAISISRNL